MNKGKEIKGLGKCMIKNCEERANAITRTINVCQRCFSKLKRDNVKRFKARVEITSSLDIYPEDSFRKSRLFYNGQTRKSGWIYL